MQELFNPGMETLAKRLRELREKAELTQVQLAESAGLRQSDISKIEQGRILKSTKIATLARVLRCNPYWLESGEGDPQQETERRSQAGGLSQHAVLLGKTFDMLKNDEDRVLAYNAATAAITYYLNRRGSAPTASPAPGAAKQKQH